MKRAILKDLTVKEFGRTIKIVVVFAQVLTCFLALTGCGNNVSGEALPSIIPWQPTATPKLPEVPLASSEPDADGAQLLGVSIAAQDAYITVSFKSPPKLAQGWQRGDLYVIDEKTGVAYPD